MKTRLMIGLFLCCTATLVPGAVEREKLKAELVRTESEFFHYALQHGFNAGLHAYMADDAFIANGLTVGRDAQALKMKADHGRTSSRPFVIRWKPLRADVSAAGDLGYTWGVAESGPGKDGPFKPYGIYVTIWRRQPDGKWKFVYDSATILTSDAVEKFLREHYPNIAGQ